MLSAHPPVPLSQITITHTDASPSPGGSGVGGGIADRRPSVSRLTLHTATGRQLHVEDHGLPSPRTLSPLATPISGGGAGTASGTATPEKSDGEDAADRIKGRDYAVGGDAFESAVRERVSLSVSRWRGAIFFWGLAGGSGWLRG
jgi:hypothetical protein